MTRLSQLFEQSGNILLGVGDFVSRDELIYSEKIFCCVHCLS